MTAKDVQVPEAEVAYQDELAFLTAYDDGPKPPGFLRTPKAVVTFIVGSGDAELTLPASAKVPKTVPRTMRIREKFVGDRALVERAVVTLVGDRALLLVGEPGTAKSMLSELLAAAVSGSSGLTVQGTAGTTEEQLRYGWNYAQLLGKGPSVEALVPSPVLVAMRTGRLARIEEVTRCLPEVQDALVSLLSDRRMAIPELGEHTERAMPGFNVIATANLRDKGVSEMSAALKRRFNFETVPPIADPLRERALVRAKAERALVAAQQPPRVDDAVLDVVVTAFRDLRIGVTAEGWSVDKPTSVMSVAEAVGVTTACSLHASFFGEGRDPLNLVPLHLLGVVEKDEPKDRAKLLAYWDSVVRRRGETTRVWKQLLELRTMLERA